MSMRKTLTLFFSMLLLTGTMLAQTRVISGKVTDDKGAPLPNASVLVKGTNTGTTTDAEGAFSFTVPATAKTLVVSAVGQNTTEITLGTKNIIDVSLRSSDKELQEVVVVGYGVQRKSDITANITTVKGSALADKPAPSFDASLGGRAAGVQITVPNGVLNNPPVFRIRGTNSINLSSYPLIVIDGVPTYTGDVSGSLAASNALSSINPNDIESMDILKDAAATAIYGSRGANGVVLITTKKGKRGKAKVTYDGWVGWTKPTRLWDMLNAEQYMAMKNEGTKNSGIADRYLPTNGPDGKPIETNWYDYAYRTGFSHSHNVSVSGGSDATTYYFSAGYTDQEGIILKNGFNRKSIRFNADHKVNKILNLGLNASYASELNTAAANSGSLPGSAYASGGLARLALALPPNISPYNNDGSYNLNGNAIGKMNNVENVTFWNPAPIIDNNYSNTENSRLQGNVSLTLRPIQDVTIRTVYGVDYLNSDNKNYYTPLVGDGYNGGSSFANLQKNRRWVWTNTAQFDHTFADKHTLGVLVGTEQQRTTTEGFGIARSNVSDPFFTNVQGGWTVNNPSNTSGQLGENYLWSGFGRLSYDFDKKYFVTVNARRDGYSAFAEGEKYGNFYSVSAMWDVSQEKFWANSAIGRVVNSLKLGARYGTVGNSNGVGDFASISYYGTGYYNGDATFFYSQAGNKQLTWETSKKTDIGLNFGLFNNLVTGELAYYKNNIDGLILSQPQSPSAGMPNWPLANVGSMYNQGFEATISSTPISNKDFRWNTSLNFTYNKNEVTALVPGVDFITSTTSSLETVSITKPGLPLGYLYVVPTAGVNPETGRRIFINAKGEKLEYNHTRPAGQRYTYLSNGQVAPDIDAGKDQMPMYNSAPKFYGGFDNTFSYKNFDLNVLLTYQGGFYVYNGTQATIRDQRFWNNSTDILRRWQKAGDVTDIPKLQYADNVSNGSAMPISDNVQKGDFVKLRNVALGYTLPQSAVKKIGLASVRAYVSGQNLAVITKYKGPDPEVSSNGNGNTNQGIDRNSVANGRVITVGLTVGF